VFQLEREVRENLWQGKKLEPKEESAKVYEASQYSHACNLVK